MPPEKSWRRMTNVALPSNSCTSGSPSDDDKATSDDDDEAPNLAKLLVKVQETKTEIVKLQETTREELTKLNKRLETIEMKLKANTSLRAKRSLFTEAEYCSSDGGGDDDDDDHDDDDNDDKYYENDIHSDSDMDIEKTASPVTEKLKQLNKRKMTICGLCNKSVPSCFPRHLMNHHSDRPEVKQLIDLKRKNASLKDIRKVTDLLRRKGNYNYSVKHGMNNYRPVRRTKERKSPAICKHCNGIFSRESFRKHWRKCSNYCEFGKESDHKYISSNDHKMMPVSKSPVDPDLKKYRDLIWQLLGDDSVAQFAMNDELIIQFFKEKYPHKKRTNRGIKHLKRLVRDVSRFVLKVKSIDESIMTMKDIYNASKFHTVLEAARQMSEINEEGLVSKTSMNSRLRSSVSRCLVLFMHEVRTTMQGEARRTILEELTAFEHCIQDKWTVEFGSFAENTKKILSVDKEIEVADPQDVVIASQYCVTRYNAAIDNLYKKICKENYDELMRLVLVHMVVLSRRRAVDIDQCTKKNYSNITRNRQFSEQLGDSTQLTVEEKEATVILDAFFTHGKGKQKTICFITKQLIAAIDALLLAQNEMHRNSVNRDLLFCKFDLPEEEWSTSCAMAWARKSMPLRCPQNFTINGLRHLAATQGSLWVDEDPTILPSMLEGLTHNMQTHELHYKRTITQRLTKSWGRKLYEATLPQTTTTDTLPTPTDRVDEAASNCMGENVDSSTIPIEENNDPPDLVSCNESLDPEWLPENEKEDSPAKLNTPKKCITRQRWTNTEHAALIRQFHQYMKNSSVPPRNLIKRAMSEESPLAKRTIGCIALHLHDIINRKSAPTRKLFEINSHLITPEAKKYGKHTKKQ